MASNDTMLRTSSSCLLLAHELGTGPTFALALERFDADGEQLGTHWPYGEPMKARLTQERIATLLERLDGTSSDAEFAAARELLALGDELPSYLLARYRKSRSYKARTSCVYFAIPFAKTTEDAVALGLEAIRDRSKKPRYYASMLLAYAQRPSSIAPLKSAVDALAGGAGSGDLLAAIDAIEHKNHNYFADRNHSGKVKLILD